MQLNLIKNGEKKNNGTKTHAHTQRWNRLFELARNDGCSVQTLIVLIVYILFFAVSLMPSRLGKRKFFFIDLRLFLFLSFLIRLAWKRWFQFNTIIETRLNTFRCCDAIDLKRAKAHVTGAKLWRHRHPNRREQRNSHTKNSNNNTNIIFISTNKRRTCINYLYDDERACEFRTISSNLLHIELLLNIQHTERL